MYFVIVSRSSSNASDIGIMFDSKIPESRRFWRSLRTLFLSCEAIELVYYG